jgi:hypothetical protein
VQGFEPGLSGLGSGVWGPGCRIAEIPGKLGERFIRGFAFQDQEIEMKQRNCHAKRGVAVQRKEMRRFRVRQYICLLSPRDGCKQVHALHGKPGCGLEVGLQTKFRVFCGQRAGS